MCTLSVVIHASHGSQFCFSKVKFPFNIFAMSFRVHLNPLPEAFFLSPCVLGVKYTGHLLWSLPFCFLAWADSYSHANTFPKSMFSTELPMIFVFCSYLHSLVNSPSLLSMTITKLCSNYLLTISYLLQNRK